MGFEIPKETYSGKVYEVTIGTDVKATFGGESVLPFYSFEGSIPHKPVIAYEIQDVPPDDWAEPLQKIYKDKATDPVTWAKFCQDELKADAIALRLIGTHPDRENRTPEEAAKTVKDVLSAINVPLIILGSNNVDKDSAVLVAASE
ncbi:MAG: acetyl-CoA decarbonylase/synthase complex subunit delta, partial [Thermodesulfovibrionales bacterium]|nr:acetyl-CoA decarbonylase/synthase complex subunit delta [Thermodesulfovibrionales bacterium]